MTNKFLSFLKGINFICRFGYSCLEILSIFITPFISLMAHLCAGTNRCLRFKCLPVPIHYYSPIPDIDDLERRKIWDKVSPLNGINFQSDQQVEFLSLLGEKYGPECKWPIKGTNNGQFYLENLSFSFGCAASLYSIIRNFQPERIIEIGSGNSSLVIQEALSKNSANVDHTGDHIIIDPYPNSDVKKPRCCFAADLINESAISCPDKSRLGRGGC